MDKMTPEEKTALEEYKKKNAEAGKANQQVANLNNLLGQARTAIKAGNYDEAITAMTTATTAKPDEGILWVTLGDAQLGQRGCGGEGGTGGEDESAGRGDYAEVQGCGDLLPERVSI